MLYCKGSSLSIKATNDISLGDKLISLRIRIQCLDFILPATTTCSPCLSLLLCCPCFVLNIATSLQVHYCITWGPLTLSIFISTRPLRPISSYTDPGTIIILEAVCQYLLWIPKALTICFIYLSFSYTDTKRIHIHKACFLNWVSFWKSGIIL